MTVANSIDSCTVCFQSLVQLWLQVTSLFWVRALSCSLIIPTVCLTFTVERLRPAVQRHAPPSFGDGERDACGRPDQKHFSASSSKQLAQTALEILSADSDVWIELG